jgi:hypothetical protein
MGRTINFIADGIVSVIDVSSPVFDPVRSWPPMIYYARTAKDMATAFQKIKNETAHKPRETPEQLLLFSDAAATGKGD